MLHLSLPPSGIKDILREDLSSFIARTFSTVDPGSEYLPNWHVDLLADYLKAVERGHITRLIINMPPRYMKSITVSVAWPAWLLGHNPRRRIIAASYAQALATRHSLDCRLVLKAPWYQALFPQTQLVSDQNEKRRFTTTERGFRFATSVDGTLTGDGGDFLIVDDPHNPTHIFSEKKRNHVLQWFDQTFSSRLNDKKKGAIVIVMQRLHPEDLSGYLLEKAPNIWEHLSIPAIADHAQQYSIGGHDYARKAGTVLHKKREGKTELERLREALGEHSFAAQYQQQPVPQEGGMLKGRWFRRYTELPSENIRRVQSWDTAIKVGEKSDYSVCTSWVIHEGNYYLTDVIRERLEYPDLKRRIVEFADAENADAVLMEDKASGQSLIQDIRREVAFPVIGIHPRSDKVTRFASVTPLFEGGKVFLPASALWLAEYERELMLFPSSPHDDQVDSTSQALTWCRRHATGKEEKKQTIRMI
jgi:predicted phage terminase large subunit-like protein